MQPPPVIRWTEGGEARSARWRSERGAPPPTKVMVVDDTITADEAQGLAGQGVALLWRGDFHNARQMLTAIAHRLDRAPRKGKKVAAPSSRMDAFNAERQARAQRARTLGMLLVPLEADYTTPLRRAPDYREAFLEAYGPGDEPSVVSLRELQGVVGAHEWRRKGVDVKALGAKIHPHYGVFAPVRSEYVDLAMKAPLPAALANNSLAFDIGTGTGVLAAVLARRGVARVIATDLDPRALACARENIERLGLSATVEVVLANLFPEGRAPLVVCNPPWVPARPSSPLEHGIYDFESRMLKGFLQGLAAHLSPGGEGWLILSDLAVHLGLRSHDEMLASIAAAGLVVVGHLDAKPTHPRSSDVADPLYGARKAEVTSLWRLAAGAIVP
ncbi:N5-glutamine methyltransferase family protein [Usitatibacter palustris]|uniref:Release factor glutamine methyltransferase n=1 Tax=Usitatibacter palustris TaxID=2732487 RepID=A0A6M4HA43_9PROT|nr:class I SAM-dependent methyltransferase [Usitatibacter palustris]QJR15264.1 Release factor glutamine methyltransferase [Usitatibacter palustris]